MHLFTSEKSKKENEGWFELLKSAETKEEREEAVSALFKAIEPLIDQNEDLDLDYDTVIANAVTELMQEALKKKDETVDLSRLLGTVIRAAKESTFEKICYRAAYEIAYIKAAEMLLNKPRNPSDVSELRNNLVRMVEKEIDDQAKKEKEALDQTAKPSSVQPNKPTFWTYFSWKSHPRPQTQLVETKGAVSPLPPEPVSGDEAIREKAVLDQPTKSSPTQPNKSTFWSYLSWKNGPSSQTQLDKTKDAASSLPPEPVSGAEAIREDEIESMDDFLFNRYTRNSPG